jgi:hypothetical protein
MQIGTVLRAGMVLLTAFPGMASAWPFVPHHPKVTTETTSLGDWRLDIAHERFSGEIACRLRSRDHKSLYRAGAVGFRFKSRWDVAAAVYRVDHSEPRYSRDDLPDLIARGVPMDRGGMDNADAGIVWIPYEHLTRANAISIEPRRDRRAVTFHFRGLVALRDIALARGCTPESRFVER